MGKELNSKLVNPKLIEPWDSLRNKMLVNIMNVMGDLSQTLYASTTKELQVVSTADDFNGVLDRFKFVTMHYNGMQVHRVDEVPNGWVPLCINMEVCDEDECEYELNPTLAELYGEDSTRWLNKLIAMFGNTVAPTVMVNAKCGVRYVNGVKMPNFITTESTYVDYVSNCVRLLYDNWGGDGPEESMEVCREMLDAGDIDLAVRKCDSKVNTSTESVFSDIAAMMSGE